MAKKILKIAGGIGSAALGGLPGLAIYAGAGGFGGKKKPTGFGEPLPVGTINPDGSAIPVDKKRRRLMPLPTQPSIASTPLGGSSTLGG